METNSSADKNLMLSVIIPSYRDKDKLVVCLDSLRKNLTGISYEVIVVENASGEDTADVIKRDYSWVTLIENEENRFYSGGNNDGIKVSKGKYVLLLNSDTEVYGDVVQQMVDFMDKGENSNIGMCNCNVYYPDGKLHETRMKYIDAGAFLARLFWGKNFIKKLGGLNDYLDSLLFIRENEDKIVECEMLSGVILLVRGDLLRKLQGFDEKYRLYYTDNELCYRIRKEGYKIVSLPIDKIIHHHSVSTQRLSKANSIIEEDTALYLKEHFGWLPYIFLFPLYILERRVMAWYLQRKFKNEQ